MKSTKHKKTTSVSCQLSDEEYLIVLKLQQKLNMAISQMVRQGLKLFAEKHN
jgi:hypothetical protein